MDEYADDSGLAEFDEYCRQCEPQPWGGEIRPSSGRFFIGHKNFIEAQKLAQWLAFESQQPVNLIFEGSQWCFTREAQIEVERLDQIQIEASQYRSDCRERAAEHWSVNEDYYNERLAEDASWGRDGSGEPFGSQGVAADR
jgi:hypothetical protein